MKYISKISNFRESCTHIASANVEPSTNPDDPEGTNYVSHFCFPFDYQFLAKDNASKQYNYYYNYF